MRIEINYYRQLSVIEMNMPAERDWAIKVLREEEETAHLQLEANWKPARPEGPKGSLR